MDAYQDIRYAARPVPYRPRMPRANRAKLFAPYDALRGFAETVHAQETVYEERRALSEYAQEGLDRALRLVERGETVTLVWFQPKKDDPDSGLGQYLTATDTVAGVNRELHLLYLGKRKIPLCEILSLRSARIDRLCAEK